MDIRMTNRKMIPGIKSQLIVRTWTFHRTRVQLFQETATIKRKKKNKQPQAGNVIVIELLELKLQGKYYPVSQQLKITSGNMFGLLFLGHGGKTANLEVYVCLLSLLNQVKKMPIVSRFFHNAQNHVSQEKRSLNQKLGKHPKSL